VVNPNYLLKNELISNITLGVVNAISNKNTENNNYTFFNLINNHEIKASCFISNNRLFINALDLNDIALRELANYILINNIEFTTISGLSILIERLLPLLLSNTSIKILQSKSLIAHQLDEVSQIETCPGKMSIAEKSDIDILVKYIDSFQKDASLFPLQSLETIRANTLNRIELKRLFVWIDDYDIVSIAAYTRETKNIGIISLVYSPPAYRGKGYASNLVKVLSESIILTEGKKACGLFTDASNPTSNSIYKKIGYQPIAYFTDVEFNKKILSE
jgi:predicted GNAT family acetyltransferase